MVYSDGVPGTAGVIRIDIRSFYTCVNLLKLGYFWCLRTYGGIGRRCGLEKASSWSLMRFWSFPVGGTEAEHFPRKRLHFFGEEKRRSIMVAGKTRFVAGAHAQMRLLASRSESCGLKWSLHLRVWSQVRCNLAEKGSFWGFYFISFLHFESSDCGEILRNFLRKY